MSTRKIIGVASTAGGGLAIPITSSRNALEVEPRDNTIIGYDLNGLKKVVKVNNKLLKLTLPVVTFKNDDGSVLHTETVEWGGSATYSVIPTSSQGAYQVFTGWSPAPINVISDMTCVAQYIVPKPLEDMSWSDISAISLAGTAADYFDVGDCKSVHLEGTVGTLDLNTTLCVYVLGFDHGKPGYVNEGITFGMFKTATEGGINVALCDSRCGNTSVDGTKYFTMNHWGNYNYGGWSACDLRYDILGSTDVAPSGYGSAKSTSAVGYNASSTCATNPVPNTLMAALPSDLRAVLKPMTTYADNKGNASNEEVNVQPSIDYLPLLAEFEVFGARSYANQYEQNKQAQYTYFATGNSKIKYNHSATGSAVLWWERSAYYNNYNHFCNVNIHGNAYTNTANYSRGLAGAFLV